MNSRHDDLMRMVRRNKLVGIWAAKRLGLCDESAKSYSDGLATATLDLERNDVLSTVRADFLAAGVDHSDEQILCVMNQSWLDAGERRLAKRADASDVALVRIVRSLQSK